MIGIEGFIRQSLCDSRVMPETMMAESQSIRYRQTVSQNIASSSNFIQTSANLSAS
jgi:hypothetical protein